MNMADGRFVRVRGPTSSSFTLAFFVRTFSSHSKSALFPSNECPTPKVQLAIMMEVILHCNTVLEMRALFFDEIASYDEL